MRDAPIIGLKWQNVRSSRFHKRCWFIQTVGRWPWKSESAKECVTTHQPNAPALKMDAAKRADLYPIERSSGMTVRVGGRGGFGEGVP